MELDEIGDERLEIALGETLAAVERGEVPRVTQILEDEDSGFRVLPEKRGHRRPDRGTGGDGAVEGGLDQRPSRGCLDRRVLLDPGARLL